MPKDSMKQDLLTLSNTITQLLNILLDDKISIHGISKIIQADQNLASMILQEANSASYGLIKHVDTLDHAMAILGINGLKKILLNVALMEQLVICVDDDKLFLKSLEFSLPSKINIDENDEIRYRFLFFDNPLIALDSIKEFEKDGETVAMVISDQKMPVMKGIEFLTEVKKVYQDSIKILLTGYADLDSAIVAINEKLLDKYLTKPIENEIEFVTNVQHLLRRFQVQRDIIEQGRIIHKLYHFANRLNGMEDFQQMLNYIVSFTKEMLRCHQVSIMLREGEFLRIRASKGIPEDVANSACISVEDQILSQAILSGKAILAKTFYEIPYLGKTDYLEVKSFISIPLLIASLISANKPFGVINASQKENNLAFTTTDLTTLTCITHTASIAINHHMRY